jgi:hypothetical protein
MSEPLTQDHVESEIQRLIRAMEAETERLPALARAASESEVAYRRERAKAYLKTEGPQHLREAVADDASAGLLLERRIAESAFDVAKERLRTIRSALDAIRSINANIRGQV